MIRSILRTCKQAYRSVRGLARPRVLQVFHHDSPGVRVFVKRGLLRRVVYSRTFSHIGERHLTIEQCYPQYIGPILLRKHQELKAEFDDWLDLTSQLDLS